MSTKLGLINKKVNSPTTDTELSGVYQNLRRKYIREIDASLTAVFQRYPIDGPVCHVGSKLYSGDAVAVDDFRSLFSNFHNREVVGIDIEAGNNVDIVADLCSANVFDQHPELKDKFGFILCSALLEHVKNPFSTAQNIEQLLNHHGYIWYSGPWVWGYHAYPDDYWRFSAKALEILFPKVEWLEWYYQGTKKNKGLVIKDLNIERKCFVFTEVDGVGQLISDRGMPYMNVTAIGRKKASQA
ncbi:MAG: class I SAM-dependent methyltransferase [Desmonostoc vinosum HA7617-LM4]|nr:class I SAM-dependent methyltransferase [Desmonostoc vinosum HA7617-LM4]